MVSACHGVYDADWFRERQKGLKTKLRITQPVSDVTKDTENWKNCLFTFIFENNAKILWNICIPPLINFFALLLYLKPKFLPNNQRLATIHFKKHKMNHKQSGAKGHILGSSDICDCPKLTTADGLGHGIYPPSAFVPDRSSWNPEMALNYFCLPNL